MHHADVNAKVDIIRSAGVCTFETLCPVERLKIAFGENDTRVIGSGVVRIVPGVSKISVCIHNKACGKVLGYTFSRCLLSFNKRRHEEMNKPRVCHGIERSSARRPISVSAYHI